MNKIFDEIALECKLDCEVKYEKKLTQKEVYEHIFVFDWDYTKVTDDTDKSILDQI